MNLVTAEGYDQTVGLWRRVDADINDDNQVTEADLDLVESHSGKAIEQVPANEQGADVNGAGTVDHNDVFLVMNVLHNTPGAPARPKPGALDTQTALYANYPNPFNPEPGYPINWQPLRKSACPSMPQMGAWSGSWHLGINLRARISLAAVPPIGMDATPRANPSPVVSISIHSKQERLLQHAKCSF